MEIFLDGGLFEFFIMAAFGYAINFIFYKKYLLITFSVLSITCPVALLFISSGRFYNGLVAVCIANSILLVIVLWNIRQRFSDQQLFDLGKLKRRFYLKKKSLKKI